MWYVFLVLYVMFRLFLLFFPTTFLGDVGISFLPYIACVDVVIVIICSIVLCKRKKIHPHTKLLRSGIGRVFFSSFLLLCGFVVYAWWLMLSCCGQGRSTDISSLSGDGLSFWYANIYKNNTNYEEIQQSLVDADPDVVLLVEYKPHHHEYLSGFFAQHYPYKNRDVHTQTYFGNMIFSKYPLEDLTKDIAQVPRKYGFVRVHKGQDDYFLYLIHTSAPVSLGYFAQRNRQLDYLSQQLHTQKKFWQDAPMMMVGDFNLSPWSIWYQTFITHIPPDIHNITDNVLLTTRCQKNLKIACANIDHIFSSTIGFLQREKFGLKGGDHDGFVGVVGKK